MSAIATGLTLGARRLLEPYLATGAAITLLLVLLVARLERSVSAAGASDRALVGAAFGIALPLFAYAVVARASDGRRWDGALDVIARHGIDRRLAALGVILACAAALALAGLVLGMLTATVAHGFGDPSWLRDGLSSASVGAVAGVCYTGWFALGSAFGREGGARFWLLVADWLLGSGTTALAVVWPRAHIRNLIGAPPVLGMGQGLALLAVVVLSSLCVAVALWRTPR
jgi:hypothetical protein